MENIRYNPGPANELIKNINDFLDSGEDYDLEEIVRKNELDLKILLRKIKLKLKKRDLEKAQRTMILEYSDSIKNYMDIIDDINVFLEDPGNLRDLKAKVEQIENLNATLIETDLMLQKFVVGPKSVTSTLPGREEIPKPSKKSKDEKRPVLKKPKLPQLDTHSSLEIVKITIPPRDLKNLPESQYEILNKKLNEAGFFFQELDLKLLARCGYDQRINMSVLNRIFSTLEEVIANYGEDFKERTKTLLLFIASNYLFIYDLSKFYSNFDDPRINIMEIVISTINTGLSITEYLSALMKVTEIVHIEESELLGEAQIINKETLSYMEWVKVNEYEINLRYKIRDYWQNWFDNMEERNEFEEDDFEMVDEDSELFMEKLTYLELKIERLPYALESPWELASWIKELFSIMKDYSFKLNRWSKIKKAELLMGTLNILEQSFINPNLYTTVRGEKSLLKLGQRVEFIKDKILSSLRDSIDTINNSWQNYNFTRQLTYFETAMLEKSLVALTLAQTAIDQIVNFYHSKNMLELVFSTQLLSIANELYSMGMVKRPILLECKQLNTFVNTFISFHLGQVTQDAFLKASDWLGEILNTLLDKKEKIKQLRKEGSSDSSIVEIFLEKALEEFNQGQSDLDMYKQTQLRLFLLTSVYSALQGTTRLIVLKELEEKYMPGDDYYEHFNIMSDLLNKLN